MTPTELDALADVMIKRRVLRCGDVEIHPSAFVAAETPAADGEPEPDFLFASSIPVTKLETTHEEPK